MSVYLSAVGYPQLFKFECPTGLLDHFYWGALLLVLVVFGPGRLALDKWIEAHTETGGK